MIIIGGSSLRYNLGMTTAYTFVPSPNHIYPDHPERPARLDILEPRLNSFGAELIETKPAMHEEIAYVPFGHYQVLNHSWSY